MTFTPPTPPCRAFFVVAAAMFGAACASADASVLPTDRPDIEFSAGPFTVAPGEDATYCTYVRSDDDQERDVAAFLTEQTAGGHHLIVYTVDHPVDLAPHRCSQGGQPSFQQVLTTQLRKDDVEFPEGVGFRVKARQQYVMETHFINTTDAPLDVTSKLGIRYAASGTVKERAATYYFGTMNIDVAPNGSFEQASECHPPKAMTLRTMFGHQHRMGVGVDVEHAKGMVYQTTDWEAPDDKAFPEGLHLSTEDALRVSCRWNNTSPKTLRYPHEMCLAVGYFWPADTSVACLTGGGKDVCQCRTFGDLDTGPGGAAVTIGVARKAQIPGAGGAIDKGAPVYCALFRAEDYGPLGPKAGAQPFYLRDAVDVPLADEKATATLEVEDVTPGDYAVACLMDVIGGGLYPGSGDVANLTAPIVSVKKGAVANVSVVLDVAIP